MSAELLQKPLDTRQAYSMPAWLVANRLKRGALLYWATLFTMSAAIIHFIGVLKQPPQSGLLVAVMVGAALIQAIIAIAVVAVPARRLLIAAAVVEAVAALSWPIAHITGIPVGPAVWRAETLSTLDLYLPVMEGVSAFFFLCLSGRTWNVESRAGRLILAALPSLFIVVLLMWVAINFNAAQIYIAIFLLTAGLPDSLLDLFLPAVGLIAVVLLLRIIIPRLRVMTPGAWRTGLIMVPALLLISLMTWAGSVNAANGAWFPSSTTIHVTAGQTTLAYCSPDGSPMAMDLTEPSSQAARPAPVVFFIHGGEGLQGNRQLDGTDGVYLAQLRDMLVNRGFVVGSIDYGLVPFDKLVNEVAQSKCAVRFLRAHASELGIDPQRIGVYGVSMGGYLAAMLGTVGPQAGFDVGQYLDQSSRVQAVVDMWGPTDLNNWSGSPGWVQAIGHALGGGGGRSSVARLKTVSPVNYVAPNDPPFLIMQGTDDWFIAPHHSQDMAKLLHAAGVPATLVMIQHDGHGLAAPTAGQIEQPGPDVLIRMISDFFARTLAA